MYSAMTFVWEGRPLLEKIPIRAFGVAEGEPSLLIESLALGIRGGGRTTFMKFGFVMSDGTKGDRMDRRAHQFIGWLIDELNIKHWTYGLGRYALTFNPVNGESSTKTMMKKYVLLLRLCGVDITTLPVPRIIEETFTGRDEQDHSRGAQLPYGVLLFHECDKEIMEINYPKFSENPIGATT